MRIKDINNIKGEGRVKIGAIDGIIDRVGDILETKFGQIQYIYLKDGENKEDRIRLKLKSNFIRPEEKGRSIRFTAGGTPQKPAGLIFTREENKVYVSVTEKAIQVKDVPITTVNDGELFSPELNTERKEQMKIKKKKEKEPLSNEDEKKTVHEEPEFREGPSDQAIIRIAKERIHIMNVICRELGLEPEPVKLFELATSIWIELSRNKLSSILPEDKTFKVVPFKAPPEKEKKEPPPGEFAQGDICFALRAYHKAVWFNTKTNKGKRVGDILTDPQSVGLFAKWYYTELAKGPKSKNSSSPAFEAMRKAIAETKYDFANEAIWADIQGDLYAKNPEPDDNVISSVLEYLKLNRDRQIALKYFSLSEEIRMEAPRF